MHPRLQYQIIIADTLEEHKGQPIRTIQRALRAVCPVRPKQTAKIRIWAEEVRAAMRRLQAEKSNQVPEGQNLFTND